MAWPPPPPATPTNTSTSPQAVYSSSSSEFFKAAKERFVHLSSLSSPMLLSTTNHKSGPMAVAEKRESAPPALRSFAGSPPSAFKGSAGKPQKGRPRSDSHVQIPSLSHASSQRPLPVLPMPTTTTMSSEDAIKVPAEDNRAQNWSPAPHVFNSNCEHPNNHFPRPKSHLSTQHRFGGHEHHPQQPYQPQLQHQQYQRPTSQHEYDSRLGTIAVDSRLLEYQASNGSSSSNHHSPENMQPSSNIVPGQQQEQDHWQGHVNGHAEIQEPDQDQRQVFGERWALQQQRQQYSHYHHEQVAAPVSDSPLHSRLLPEGADKSHHLTSSAHLSPAASTPSSSSISSSRLPNSNTPPSPSTVETNAMSSEPPTSKTPLALSPSSLSFSSGQSHQNSLNSGELQPYCPPPPPDITSPLPHHQHQSTKVPTPSNTSSNAGTIPSTKQPGSNTTTGPTTALVASRGRRHSSAANTLSIQTKQLNSIKRGPNTADIGNPAGVGTGSRYLDSDTIAQGTARKHLKSIKQPLSVSASNLPPRQSPNHLAIPHPSHNPPFLQNQHQRQSHQSNQGHGQHQHQHHEQSKNWHQNQNQNQDQRVHSHSRYQQQQQQHHQNPAPHSPNSPRITSLSGIELQDRTAMALMQQYLTQPSDPDSEADIAMQILISQAAVDSKGFEILVPQTVEGIKRHHATLSSRIAALTARLSLESKIAEAAQSLLKLHANNKKLARQASSHLEAANRKVDQVATELWKLTQLAADLQRTLLQHTSGVLALGVVRLEDQSRRERELHAQQIQDTAIDQSAEEQLKSMSKTIMSLESDALEAQSLLEDKDRAIERLMSQLEHQRDLFIKFDEQQQKTMALSRSQQKNMGVLPNNENKDAPEVDSFLAAVGKRLQTILQQQQNQQEQLKQHKKYRAQEKDCSDQSLDAHSGTAPQKDRTAQTWPSGIASLFGATNSKQNQDPPSVTPVREDSIPSVPSDGNLAGTATVTLSETAISSKPCSVPISNNDILATSIPSPKYSMDRINTTLDALESHVSESQQKMQVLEGELGLLRRQSVVLSESRNNSIRIKSGPSSTRTQVEDTIRAALEKSLKDALLEKELARQELENERQRWQEDQNHRISALEKSLIAAEDTEKSGENGIVSKSNGSQASEETVQTLAHQLREAIEEIDVLSQQQQSSLKSMRQLFDLVPDLRRKSHYQLFASYHQLQQKIVSSASPNGTSSGDGGHGSGRNSPVGSVSSFTSSSTVGFSMEALVGRIKELVARSQQLEQDNSDLKQQLGQSDLKCHKSRSQSSLLHSSTQPSQLKQQQLESTHNEDPPQSNSVWILKSELERLQASAGMIQLLEKELDLLKQHTDMLLDENARLADLAAANVTGVSPPPNCPSDFGGLIKKPMTRDDELEELQEIIRVKDKLLRDQERSLQQTRDDMDKNTQLRSADAEFPLPPSPSMSSFDVKELDGYRIKCGKLEEEVGEMRMTIAALESMHGGPGSGSQLLKASASSSNAHSPLLTTWLSSGLSAVGSLNFGSMSHHNSSDIPSGISSPIPSSVDAFYNNQQAANGSTSSLTPSGSSAHSGGGGQLNGNAAVAGATAALRKEFRRVMSELRDEKERSVRKEVDERRRLERTVRQLRRELQAVQSSAHA